MGGRNAPSDWVEQLRPDREPLVRRTVDDSEAPSMAVVQALVAATMDEPDLPPLDDRIDLDALDTLFANGLDGQPREDGLVAFRIGGLLVVVEPRTSVEVYRPAD